MNCVLFGERDIEKGFKKKKRKKGFISIRCTNKEMCGAIFGYYLANTIRKLKHGSEVPFCQFKREGLADVIIPY